MVLLRLKKIYLKKILMRIGKNKINKKKPIINNNNNNNNNNLFL